VKELIAQEYPADAASTQAARDGALASAALIGAVLGQLVFGALADQMGRRLVFVATLACVVAGSLLSAACVDIPALGGIYGQLIACRFLLGFGIGGEYPLSATVASESSQTASESTKAVSAVFAMQGVGNLLAAALTWLVLAVGTPHWLAWRVLLGVGGIPGLATLPWRWSMEESAAFRAAADSVPPGSAAIDDTTSSGSLSETEEVRVHDSTALEPDTDDSGELRDEAPLVLGTASAGLCGCVDSPTRAGGRLGRTLLVVWEHRWSLAGTATAWFLFDVAFYAVGLFSGRVIEVSGVADADDLASVAGAQVAVALMAIPGYFVGMYTLERFGAAEQQLAGFTICSLWFGGLAVCWRDLERVMPAGFVLAYGATFFFMNWGPNMTTYVLPTLAFPTEAKATCHGLSAASGKIGAALGAAALPAVLGLFGGDSSGSGGLTAALAACGVVLALGAASTRGLLSHLFGPTVVRES
jgi:PHS family inorganic phosphate transporter-like MFS transporter